MHYFCGGSHFPFSTLHLQILLQTSINDTAIGNISWMHTNIHFQFIAFFLQSGQKSVVVNPNDYLITRAIYLEWSWRNQIFNILEWFRPQMNVMSACQTLEVKNLEGIFIKELFCMNIYMIINMIAIRKWFGSHFQNWHHWEIFCKNRSFHAFSKLKEIFIQSFLQWSFDLWLVSGPKKWRRLESSLYKI